MKSIIQKFGIVVVFLLTFLQAAAYDFEVDGVYYNKLSNNEVEITTNDMSRSPYTGDFIIPSEVNYSGVTYKVTSIGDKAFLRCDNLPSVYIPATITNIGASAFNQCHKLTTITIPNSVTTIGESAFRMCWDLEGTITIPNSVKSIGSFAFDAGGKITSIIIGSGVSSIGESAFESNNVESIIVDDKNTTYDSRDHCNAIIETASNKLISGCNTTIIPESVRTIGKDAFNECEKLQSLEVPNGVVSIEDFAFYCCEKLTSLSLPNSLISIGNAFSACRNLTTLTIPRSVESIGDYLFIETDENLDITILSTALQISSYKFLSYIPESSTISAYKSQTDKIRTYWKGTLNELDDIIHITNINTGLTSCSFKVTIDDGYEIMKITSDQGNVSQNNNSVTISNTRQYQAVYVTIQYKDKTTEQTYKHNQYVGTTKYTSYDESIGIEYLWSNGQQTQTSLTFAVKVPSTINIERIAEWGVQEKYGKYYPCDESGIAKVSDIHSWDSDGKGTRHQFKAYVLLKGQDRGYESDYIVAYNKSLEPSIKISFNNAASFTATVGWAKGDAEITNQYLKLDDNDFIEITENTTEFGFYEPLSTHTLTYQIKAYGVRYSTSKEFRMPGVEWSDGESIALSTTSARLKYGVNLPDDAVGTGFEWRRIDAPDLVASSTVGCICVDGYLVGTLNNLNPDVYYKFRPFYKSPATGTTYYGDWVGIFTGDATVFFEPEIITSLPQVKETSATLHGYAIQGTETIKAQGFEYRAVGSATASSVQSQWIQMPSTDANMVVELSDLKPGYTYEYRGYVTTATQTYYSPVQQFTTIEQSGVSDVMADEFTVDVRSTGDEVFVKAQNAPTDVRCIIYNINGSIMGDARIECSDDWTSIANLRRGIYILQAISGDTVQTKRFIVR